MAQAIVSSKNVLLTVLVILTLVGSMGALSFNMFQNSMMSLFERQSFETGDAVLHKLDAEILRDVAKDPTAQREKREKLTEQLDEVTKELRSVGQTYVVGAKQIQKVSAGSWFDYGISKCCSSKTRRLL